MIIIKMTSVLGQLCLLYFVYNLAKWYSLISDRRCLTTREMRTTREKKWTVKLYVRMVM